MGPGKITLDALIATVRRRADLVNSAFLSDAEITDFLRSSAGELWDALVTAYSGYAEASKVYTTDGTNALACPADMLKADGLDLEISEVNSVRITLKRIAWSDRNKYRWPLSTPWPTHYALRGDSIYLFPTPAAGKSITLWYVPRCTPLANSGTIQILPELSAGHHVTINGVRFVFGPGEGEIAMGGTPTITAAGFAFAISSAASNPASLLYGLSATPVQDTVTVTCVRPKKVTISDASPTLYSVVDEWISYLDGFDGWEELLVLDTVIKCKLKDEQDVTPEVTLKDRLQQRIKDAAANRDQGGPGVVSEIWDPYEMNVGLGPYYSRWGW